MKGKLYLTGAFSLAGTSVVTGYFLVHKLGCFTITVISMSIVLVCLLPVYCRKILYALRRMNKHEFLTIALQALFGIFLFRLFLLLGVQRTSTADAGILTGTAPAITAFLAFFILRERPSALTVLGILATVLGIYSLQGNGSWLPDFSSGHLLGNFLILCAAASESAFNILSRKYLRGQQASSTPLHPMVRTVLVCFATLILSVVPAILEQPAAAFATLDIMDWLALIWYGLFVTALAFSFFFAGAARCDAYTIAAFSGMMPLTSMLLSVILLQETLSAAQWIGGVLIITGMTVIARTNRRVSC